jgi:uncharacterized protein
MPTASFHFDEILRTLLRTSHRHGQINVAFSGSQTAKHLIEALGVPHTEIREVIANKQAGALDSLVRDEDSLVVSGKACESMADEPVFVLDGHLGRLAAGLRMLGLDCNYQRQPSDADLVRISHDQSRILLSRDRRLLMRKAVVQGYVVRSQAPDIQLAEVCRRFDLAPWFQPFRRCIRCNALLAPAQKESLVDRLLPLTRLYYDDFRVCPNCSQPYWAGSHLAAMEEKVRRLTYELGGACSTDRVGPDRSAAREAGSGGRPML